MYGGANINLGGATCITARIRIRRQPYNFSGMKIIKPATH